jgi:hypothetical protein
MAHGRGSNADRRILPISVIEFVLDHHRDGDGDGLRTLAWSKRVTNGVCLCGLCGLHDRYIGLVGRSWNDTAFWSIVVTLIAFIAVAGHPMPNQSIAFGWGLVAAGCGSLCGARYPKQVWLGVLMSGVLGIVLMCLSIFFAQASVVDLLALFDIASAGLVGGLTRLFIELINSLIRRAHVSRLVFAAWIISCVVIGRATVPWAVAWLVPRFFGD